MYMDMYDDDDGTHVIIHVIITEHIIIVYSLRTISRLCECVLPELLIETK